SFRGDPLHPEDLLPGARTSGPSAPHTWSAQVTVSDSRSERQSLLNSHRRRRWISEGLSHRSLRTGRDRPAAWEADLPGATPREGGRDGSDVPAVHHPAGARTNQPGATPRERVRHPG